MCIDNLIETNGYKIINGDCLKLLGQMKDNSVDLILTDPPYNIAKYSTGNINLPGRTALNNDLGKWDLETIDPFLFVDEFKRIMKPDGNIFIFTSYNLIGKWHEAFDSQFDTFQFFIWHKTNPAPKIFKNGFLNSCEMIVCMWNKGHKWNFSKQNEMHNFFQSPICMRPERLTHPKHPAQKPVKLLEHLIKIASNKGDVVLDPFMGVGSTGIAALKNNRKFIGIEIEKEYFDAAANRIYDYRRKEMENIKLKLTEFIQKELSSMSENIINNFEDNMKNRENNPFLAFEDEDIKKYMGLGRSVDSQLGNRLQRIIFYISRMRYGNLCVPNLVTIDIDDEEKRNITFTLYSYPCEAASSELKKGANPYKQTIHVHKNLSEARVKSYLKIKEKSTVLEHRDFKFYGVHNDTFDFIKKLKGKVIPVDLLFFECDDDKTLKSASAFEIKMGGNLDTKNSKSNANEVADLKRLLGFIPCNLSYFATCYGNCSHAVASEVKAILGEHAILNNSAFWNKVLPEDKEALGYDEFISIFREAFQSTGLEEKLQKLTVKKI